MIIQIPTFNGIVPKATPEALGDTNAQDAMNCNFVGGTLTGLRKHHELPELGTLTNAAIKSGFVWSHMREADYMDSYDGLKKAGTIAWQAYSWPYDTNAVRSPVQDDKHHRFYWTGMPSSGVTEFRYALVQDPNKTSTYGEPQGSYKVGVIDSDQWNYKPESMFLTASTRNIGLPTDQIEAETFNAKIYVVGTDGDITKGKRITYEQDGVTLMGRDGSEVNGAHMVFDVVLPKKINEFASNVVSGTTYNSYGATLTYLNSTESAQTVTVWYTTNKAAPVAVMLDAGRGYPTISKTYNGGDSGSSEYSETYQTAAGDIVDVVLVADATYNCSLKFLNTNNLIANNLTNLPDGLSAQLRGDLQLAIELYFKDTSGVAHTGRYFENASQNEVIQLASSIINVSITTDDDINYVLEIQSGYNLPIETRAYVFTFVNQLGEESPPSDPIEVTLNPGREVVTFKLEASAVHRTYPAINEGRYPGNGLRFYRTATSTTGDTEFLYAFSLGGEDVGGVNLDGDVYVDKTITFATETIEWQIWTFKDTIANVALGAACPTQYNVRDTNELQKLQGLTAINNGMFAAFKNNEVWISEPYTPWAFRSTSIKTLPHRIVSLVALEAGFVALTELAPYYFSGQTPEQMQPQRIPSEYPCVGKNAAVAIGNAILYISPDGPVTINGMQAVVDTSAWSRESWRDDYGREMVKDHIELATFGHRLLAYFPGKAAGYVFDTEDGNWTRTDTRMDCAVHLPANSFVYTFDQIAFANGDVVDPFWSIYAASNTGSTMPFTWHSKRFTMPKPTNFGVVQLFGSGTCVVDVFVDGALSYTTPTLTLSTSGVIARLPSGFLSAKWSFRVNGEADTTVTRLNIATTIRELQGV